MNTKKAQMEIMGLVIIIIMLAILSIIFLTFALRPSPSTTPMLRTSTKADNLLNSIIRTSTPKGKLLDLIAESYTNNDFILIKQEISKIIHKTLPNKQYSFKLLINKEKVLQIGSCKLGISSTKTIKHKDNTFKFILLIC